MILGLLSKLLLLLFSRETDLKSKFLSTQTAKVCSPNTRGTLLKVSLYSVLCTYWYNALIKFQVLREKNPRRLLLPI